jgi:RNA polymerase sigma factor (sigma-70 family)
MPPMIEDHELLRRYAEEGASDAFAELVRRRIGLVFSVALRQTYGDTHRAEDVTQQVFVDLARKAGPLSRRPVLLGWLYRSTTYAARHALRTETRRRHREAEAQLMNELEQADAPPPDWERLRPTLDQVLHELDERDRDAVLLRYFENRSFAEIGRYLHLTENAARMRVERALDKLHALLARRSVTSTGAAIGLALASQASTAAPAGLAAAVTSGAIAAAGAGTVGATAWGVTFMASIKTQLGVTAGVLAVTTVGLVSQARQQTAAQQELTPYVAAAQQLPAQWRAHDELQDRRREADTLRQVDTEYQRLREQIDAVRQRQLLADRAEAEARSKRPSPSLSGPVFHLNQLDGYPRPKAQTPPQYPGQMRAAGVTGEAVVALVVGADGRVNEVEAISSTHPEFAAAATEAVAKWEFEPGNRAGVAVNTRLQVPIVFSINDTKSAGPGLKNWW